VHVVLRDKENVPDGQSPESLEGDRNCKEDYTLKATIQFGIGMLSITLKKIFGQNILQQKWLSDTFEATARPTGSCMSILLEWHQRTLCYSR
jgi:hypothetical protein